jgi:hypothetical protein
LFAMYVAVPIPPLRLFRLGGESRDDGLRPQGRQSGTAPSSLGVS